MTRGNYKTLLSRISHTLLADLHNLAHLRARLCEKYGLAAILLFAPAEHILLPVQTYPKDRIESSRDSMIKKRGSIKNAIHPPFLTIESRGLESVPWVRLNRKEYIQQLTEQKDCKNCSMAKEIESELLVFMSFATPENTWKDLSLPLEKAGGVFVIRGLPQNSFEAFIENILRLREAGVMAQIDLDPTLFEQHNIEETPAVVLREKGRFDKLSGNLRLEAALEILKEHGETSDAASRLLKQIRDAK